MFSWSPFVLSPGEIRQPAERGCVASLGSWSLSDLSPPKLKGRRYRSLDLFYTALIPFVEGPSLDPLRLHEIGLTQHPHVFAQRRLRDAEFFGYQNRAYTVLDKISVNLGAEVSLRVFQQIENLKPLVVSKSLKD